MKLIYICAPMRAKTLWETEKSVHRVREKAVEVLAFKDLFPLVPHTLDGLVDDESFFEGCLELLRRSDGVLMIPKGEVLTEWMQRELVEAKRLEIPVSNDLQHLVEMMPRKRRD